MTRTMLILLLVVGCGRVTGGATRHPAVQLHTSELVAASSPAVWFEGFWTPARISPNGDRAVLGEMRTGDLRMLDLATGAETALALEPRTGAIDHTTFTADGTLAVSAVRDGVPGWYQPWPEPATSLSLPPDALPVWAPAGDRIAWFRRAAPDTIVLMSARDHRVVHVPGVVTAIAWDPQERWLLALAGGDDGASTLYRVPLHAGDLHPLVRGLDAPIATFGTHRPIAISPDGQRAYLALAGDRSPNAAARHRPRADRDLDIYEVDLRSGSRRVIASTPGDDFGPAVVGGWLYWSSFSVELAVVALPTGGGAAHVVVPNAMLPTWRPDGRAMGFTFGDWRQGDWVLNWDGGIVDLDSAARPIGELRPFIEGHHEDFSPVWSPNGRWIAYHSHRSSHPVAHYHAAGSTDDLFLRRAESTEEVRLTDFGYEVGPPSWAPDGTRIVFTGWLRASGGSGAWITTIDTATGSAVGHHQIPLPPEVGGAANATWSPVADVIAVSAPAPDGRRTLWTVSADGSVIERIAQYPMRTYGGVDWMPDGQTLVFPVITDGRSQLHAVAASGGTPRRLSQDTANLFHPAVSPDGRWIAATRILHRRELRRLRL